MKAYGVLRAEGVLEDYARHDTQCNILTIAIK